MELLRVRGLVGYDVSLTRRRPPVRIRPDPLIDMAPEKLGIVHFESPRCNLNCVFCEVNSKERPPTLAERFERIKELSSDRSIIRFSGGEPTMHSELPELIKFAKEQGFRFIELETNGVALSDPSFASLLKESGVTSLFMNTVSCKKEIYEQITQTPGSFEKFEKALSNIGKLRLPLGANLALTKRNYSFEHFRKLFEFLKERNVDVRSFSFRVFRVNERSVAGVGEYMPRHEDVAAEIRKMVSFCRERGIQVKDSGSFSLPLCVCEGIEEYHVSREKKSRDYFKRVFFKPPACGECAMRDLCVGVSKAYPYKFEPKPFDKMLEWFI